MDHKSAYIICLISEWMILFLRAADSCARRRGAARPSSEEHSRNDKRPTRRAWSRAQLRLLLWLLTSVLYHGRTFGGRRALISEAFPLVTLCPSSLIDGSQLKSTNTGLCSEALKHHPETPSLCLLWIASLTCLFAFSDAFSFFFLLLPNWFDVLICYTGLFTRTRAILRRGSFGSLSGRICAPSGASLAQSEVWRLSRVITPLAILTAPRKSNSSGVSDGWWHLTCRLIFERTHRFSFYHLSSII